MFWRCLAVDSPFAPEKPLHEMPFFHIGPVEDSEFRQTRSGPSILKKPGIGFLAEPEVGYVVWPGKGSISLPVEKTTAWGRWINPAALTFVSGCA